MLIVDDEPYNLMILEQLFQLLGQRVVKADDGKLALETVEERVQSLVKSGHRECSVFRAIIMDY